MEWPCPLHLILASTAACSARWRYMEGNAVKLQGGQLVPHLPDHYQQTILTAAEREGLAGL